MRFILNTGRTIVQGCHVEDKYSETYVDEVSTCRMNVLDMLELGVEEGENVSVTCGSGSVVLKVAAAGEDIPCGSVFVPYGPYINHIMPEDTHSTGMPDFKSVVAVITPTTEPRKTLHDLIEDLGGRMYEIR